ncbi:MAG TPA: hypothetical protein DIV39_04280 [Verrucomicrobiales bacterium]|nr:hypothetical protein [Verrucomicrobiales bacterium]
MLIEILLAERSMGEAPRILPTPISGSARGSDTHPSTGWTRGTAVAQESYLQSAIQNPSKASPTPTHSPDPIFPDSYLNDRNVVVAR